jgi:hypothetical protein
VKDFDEFELVDYAGIQARQEAETKESQRQAKRAEKLCSLEEADEMKFSHSLQFNAVPDWSSHYIAYSNLKKLYVAHVPPFRSPSAVEFTLNPIQESTNSRRTSTARHQPKTPKTLH